MKVGNENLYQDIPERLRDVVGILRCIHNLKGAPQESALTTMSPTVRSQGVSPKLMRAARSKHTKKPDYKQGS